MEVEPPPSAPPFLASEMDQPSRKSPKSRSVPHIFLWLRRGHCYPQVINVGHNILHVLFHNAQHA